MVMQADAARQHFQRVRARFQADAPAIALAGAHEVQRRGREVELVVAGDTEPLLRTLRTHRPEDVQVEALTLEEILMTCLRRSGYERAIV